MHPVRKQRLVIVLFIVCGASVAAALVFYALRDNLNLFYSPSEVAAGKAPHGTRIRAGGMVREGSVQRAPQGLAVTFVVTDYEHDVTVSYEGILPDLFAEGQGVVALGQPLDVQIGELNDAQGRPRIGEFGAGNLQFGDL